MSDGISQRIALSLVSHTNVGKTTLARTRCAMSHMLRKAPSATS
jgi:peptide subunit release factor RF-3